MNGKRPSSGAPIRSNDGGVVDEEVLEQRDEHARHDEEQSDGARVAPQLPEHARGRGGARRSRRALRGDQSQERLVHALGPGTGLDLLGPFPLPAGGRRAGAGARRSARPRPSRGSRRAASRPRPRACANACHRSRRSSGSRPTVGSSRTSSSGRPTSAVASDTRERWPPDSRSTTRSASLAEADQLDRVVDLPARRADQPREIAEVLAHGEVAVDGRRLGGVGDPAPEGRRAGGLAEHRAPSRTRRAVSRRSSASGSTCRCRSGRGGPSPSRGERRA